MSLNNRKRQKKVERRNAKQRKRQLARRGSDNLTVRFQRIAAAPLLHCRVAKNLFRDGIGMAVFARKLADGSVAFATFLLDVYCLGVKDANYDIVPRAIYEERFEDGIFVDHPVVDYSPESFRKLVEDAVAYAQDLGLPPHRDYAKARLIFGDVDASASRDTFTFGCEGKPFYVSGPFDSAEKSRRIVETLVARCGEGNCDYVVALPNTDGLKNILLPPQATADVDDDAYDDFDDDGDEYDEDGEQDDSDDEFDDEAYDEIVQPPPPTERRGGLGSLANSLNPFRRGTSRDG